MQRRQRRGGGHDASVDFAVAIIMPTLPAAAAIAVMRAAALCP